MKRASAICLSVGLLVALSACGSSTTDRATTGAGIGAAAGAVVGAVTGLGPLGGALLGSAAGAATGALTRQDQVDLGKPVWRQGGRSDAPAPVRQVSAPAAASAAPPPAAPAFHPAAADSGADPITVKNIQYGLGRLGYDAGPADGSLGPRTRSAISRYQQDNGLPGDGQPSASLWEHIRGRI
jgi:osmotically inducible lipoprotein OsmB